MLKFNTSNLEEFNEVVKTFFKKLNKGDVILLKGEIGTGKTTFVKEIARLMDIDQLITSPTYSILKIYDEKLCHIDAYRISQEDLEIETYISDGYICFIEWAENISEYLTNIKYEVEIFYSENFDERVVTIKEY